MNIDLEKAKDEGFNLADIEVLKGCEIKVNCADCAYFDEEPIKRCLSCIHDDHVDNFKPKQNELDNLFIGAPVMVTSTGREWPMSEWNGKKWPNNFKLRLPTVAESPCNVWLAKWLHEPDRLPKFYDDNGYCRVKLRKKGSSAIWDLYELDWDEVEAIMILEDLNK